MKRREFQPERKCQPIRGAKFTFRTLHSPDGRRRGGQGQFTLDKRITVTLAAIDGEEHKMTPCMMVQL